ncbi:Argonaute-binding protein 1 [Ceratocystis fimbriata CBS 114723]|uniref:Argonaute-binding protein 1 n=1 Tax=Ceratocystis fimbriata CBS 114723 TaxID=1035309 RepID=A0A2C5WZM9_9PEZI|nr:Argonaute-binding protein 1 [Ceratocystis fimbriata CBS 114723]
MNEVPAAVDHPRPAKEPGISSFETKLESVSVAGDKAQPSGTQKGMQPTTVVSDTVAESAEQLVSNQDGLKTNTTTEPEKIKKSHPNNPPKRGPTSLAKSCGTGFEEYYADPPMRPDEAQEERENIYSSDKPFPERIAAAITRFKGRRRLVGELPTYFSDYLAVGGLDTFQNPFQGSGVNQSSPDCAPASLEPSLDGHSQRWWSPDDPNWVVDFTGVAAGFISYSVPIIASSRDPQSISKCISVVANFLRYLLMHDVCNEYIDDIKGAMQLCKRAETELPMSISCRNHFPGLWNSLLDSISENEIEEEPAMPLSPPANLARELEIRSNFRLPAGFNPVTFLKIGLEMLGKNVDFDFSKLEIVRRPVYSLQVQSIEPGPTFRFQVFENGQTVTYPSLDRITFKHCVIESDMDPGEYKRSLAVPSGYEVMLLDTRITNFLRKGMKVRAIVAELNNGVKFIKSVFGVHPEFYVFLPQNLMRSYRSHEPATKPPPSALDTGEQEEGDYEECK